jgi:hypothetical protein
VWQDISTTSWGSARNAQRAFGALAEVSSTHALTIPTAPLALSELTTARASLDSFSLGHKTMLSKAKVRIVQLVMLAHFVPAGKWQCPVRPNLPV